MIRRVLAFLALFGSGLGLLLALSGKRLPTRITPRESLLATADDPGLTLDDPSMGSAVLIPDGRLEYSKAVEGEDGWTRRFELEAEDSSMLAGGSVQLNSLRIQLFEPGTGELFGVVLARVGRTSLEQSADSLQPELSGQIELDDVELTLLSGTRLVPLTLTTSTLHGDLERGVFTTAAPARVVGSGLAAEGVGLRLDLAEGRARFERDAECEVSGAGTLAGESSGSGRIASAGPLEIRRLEGTGEGQEETRLELTAEQRALLVVEGDEGLRLSARSIRVVGRASDAGDESDVAADDQEASSLVFERLEANGEVNLLAQGHEFLASTATFRTTSTGELSNARLEGRPSAWLRVESPEGTGSALDEEQVQVSGDSSMTLDWQPNVVFQVAGPARLVWRDTVLTAVGGVSGSPPVDQVPATFHAWTRVELDHEGWRIETDEVDGTIELPEQTVATEAAATNDFVLELVADQDTRIQGRTVDGEGVQLRAARGLEFRGGRDGWHIPRAEGVTLTLDGETPLNGSADRILSFDPKIGAFEAIGAVELKVAEALLRGARLTAEGPGRVTVQSGDGERVSYLAEDVSVEARELVRQGRRVTASGDVQAELLLDSLVAKVRTERLEVAGAALADDPDERAKGPTTVTATGNVVADIVQGDERYDLEGDSLWLQRTPEIDTPGALTELRMVGRVQAEGESSYGRFELRSRELEGLIVDRDDQEADPASLLEDADGQLVATGDVWMRTLDDRQLEARSERLSLFPGGRAVFEPSEEQLVRISGLLPEQARPFTMTAQRVEATQDRLLAERPTMELLKPIDATESTPLDGLVARGLELDAGPERIALEGDVSILGSTPQGDSWSLQSDRAAFEGTSGEGVSTALSRMVAEGSVYVEYGEGPRARGDKLMATAWSGRIRLEGNPAIVQLEGFAHGAEWIEFDTRDYLLSSSGGWLDTGLKAGDTDVGTQR